MPIMCERQTVKMSGMPKNVANDEVVRRCGTHPWEGMHREWKVSWQYSSRNNGQNKLEVEGPGNMLPGSKAKPTTRATDRGRSVGCILSIQHDCYV